MIKGQTNYAVFAIGLFITVIAAALIIPGLDILAWHMLQPVGFWQKAILVTMELITAFPRGLLMLFVFVGLGKLAVIASEA